MVMSLVFSARLEAAQSKVGQEVNAKNALFGF